MSACLDCGGAECICRGVRLLGEANAAREAAERKLRALTLLLGPHRDAESEANQRHAFEAAAAAYDLRLRRGTAAPTDSMRVALMVALDIADAVIASRPA